MITVGFGDQVVGRKRYHHGFGILEVDSSRRQDERGRRVFAQRLDEFLQGLTNVEAYELPRIE